MRSASSLLDRVPATCALLDDVDPDLGRRVQRTISTEVAHRPLVTVDGGAARTVVATTTYEEPGVELHSAAWRVEGSDVVAINAEDPPEPEPTMRPDLLVIGTGMRRNG